MRNDYLTNLLMPIVDEENLQLAGQIDEHLLQIWESKAPPIWVEMMNQFELKRSDNPEAEFMLLIMLMKAMLNDQ